MTFARLKSPFSAFPMEFSGFFGPMSLAQTSQGRCGAELWWVRLLPDFVYWSICWLLLEGSAIVAGRRLFILCHGDLEKFGKTDRGLNELKMHLKHCRGRQLLGDGRWICAIICHPFYSFFKIYSTQIQILKFILSLI